MEEATQNAAIPLGHKRDHHEQDECAQHGLEKNVTTLDGPEDSLKGEKDAIKSLEYKRDGKACDGHSDHHDSNDAQDYQDTHNPECPWVEAARINAPARPERLEWLHQLILPSIMPTSAKSP